MSEGRLLPCQAVVLAEEGCAQVAAAALQPALEAACGHCVDDETLQTGELAAVAKEWRRAGGNAAINRDARTAHAGRARPAYSCSPRPERLQAWGAGLGFTSRP